MADDHPSDDGDVDVAVQPALAPELELPDYHGRKAVGMKTKLTGAGTRINRPHAIGDRVVIVIEARAKGDGHEETDEGILYVQTLKVLDLFELPGETGARLISTIRQAYRVADDERGGKTALGSLGVGDDLTAAGVTDGSGVALTADELAELRGDPVRAMLDDKTTPVVVLYSDGARELWPDDFDPNSPRPVAGERFKTGGDGPVDYVYVAELLDVGTGETIAQWTEDQENARLLEGEKAAEKLEHEEEIERKLAETGEAIAAEVREASSEKIEADLEAGLEPLGTGEPLEPPLPGEAGPEDVVVGEQGAEIVEFPGAAARLAEETNEPTPEDYLFVDRNLDDVVDELPMILELGRARRILEAENRGRGRNLKTRKGAVEAIEKRIAELEKADQ